MRPEKIAIFGGGTTGCGLAQVIALRGIEVVVVERSRAAAHHTKERLAARMDAEIAKYGLTEGEKRTVLARIQFTAHPGDAAAAELFIEAVPELLPVKRRILREIEAIEDAGARCTKLTNCAALPVSDIQEGLASPGKVIGFHVLPPAESVRVVELVQGRATEEDTLTEAKDLAKRLGKRPVPVFEYPGYITTRILVPILNEAMHALMEGVASAEEIDATMKACTGMDRGPLAMADQFGLDQVLHWMISLHRELGDPKFLPCPLLRRKVRRGHLGVKSGQGIFSYEAPAP